MGHSEVVTAMRFTADCKRLVSVGADGCIFVWKVSDDLATAMQQRLSSGPRPDTARDAFASPPSTPPRTADSSVQEISAVGSVRGFPLVLFVVCTGLLFEWCLFAHK